MGRARADIVAFHDHSPPEQDFGSLFRDGLERRERSFVGQMLLDRRSQAFQRLAILPEYYLVRAEMEIVRDRGMALANIIGPAAQLIDLGSGFGPQIERLLRLLDDPWAYVAVDRDPDPLLADARAVQARYSRLWVEAVCADPRAGFDLPSNAGGGRRVVYMPGSAIGNFEPVEALELLRLWGRKLRKGGLMLVGVDLRKSVLIVEAAYDDAFGVHASLAHEILRRANRDLGADFDPRLFEHRVHYDADHGRVRADLVSVGRQEVHVGKALHRFEEGEAIHIEHSWKYSVEDFQALARGAGFRPARCWLDAKELFSLHLLEIA